ncbi:HAMP domain-containing sensor histidine kinase [Gordonia sp. L191]|uniref:sensor histidine kinase n=1 Tax=Gordonia sp. L191 TaxID=2982699 RepID=UPI0024BF387A|nr:HAMP domain-containing sensor histidine kinase [Gordonia sp. L191]WHU47505.1 HAMP domain-containing sensor histidine kinase [Gordonia sp. L191]
MGRSLSSLLPIARWGVRAQSALIAAVVVAVALGVGGIVTLFMLHQANTDAMYRSTARQAYQIATAISHGGPAAVDSDDLAPGAGVDVMQVLDSQGHVVTASPGAPSGAVRLAGYQPADSAVPADDSPVYADDVYIPGFRGEYCATAVSTSYAGRRYTVVALDRATGIRSSEWTMAAIMAIELPLVVALGAAAVYFLVGRSLRPVSRIARRVDEISATRLGQRVPVPDAHDEIRSLALTMNGMLSRLESNHDAQLRFVGDASHELRSPLTTVVGLLDLADDTRSAIDVQTVRAVLLPEARRMQHIVDDLLLLARADESGLAVIRTDIDLDDIIGAEITRLRSSNLVAVHPDMTPIRMVGDRDMITRAVRNLTDNAVRYARSTVTLSLTADSGEAMIVVGDDGPGVPASERERIFNRFARVDADRRHGSGAGLGLAIVREIANAHGGRVTVHDGPAGGAEFVLRLPLPETPASGDYDIADSVRPQPVPGTPDGLDRQESERLVDPSS